MGMSVTAIIGDAYLTRLGCGEGVAKACIVFRTLTPVMPRTARRSAFLPLMGRILISFNLLGAPQRCAPRPGLTSPIEWGRLQTGTDCRSGLGMALRTVAQATYRASDPHDLSFHGRATVSCASPPFKVWRSRVVPAMISLRR